MTLFLDAQAGLPEHYFEPAEIKSLPLPLEKSGQDSDDKDSVHPLAFLPPGDFRYFSVPFGEFNLSFARKHGRLWGYVDSGGLSLDALLESENPEKSEAALVPITEDGNGLLFVNTGTGEDAIIRIRLDGRLVKVVLGHKGVFVADMGSLRPERPDPLVIPPHQKALTHLSAFTDPIEVELHNPRRNLFVALVMDNFVPHMTESPVGARKVAAQALPHHLWAPVQYNGQCALAIEGQLAHASILCDRITLLMESGQVFFGRLPV